MKTYSFTLTLASVDVLTPEMFDALFEVGCDDATMGSSDGVVSLDFHRQARNLGEAVGSAIQNIESAGYRVAGMAVEAMPV